jgi:hypothetical protein
VAVKVLNDNTDGDLPEKYTRVSWEEALAARGCNLLVEDLIAIKKETELKALQKILNYNAHHHALPNVILISHSATSTGLFPLLRHLTHICFMTSQSTSPSILAVLGEFKVPKATREEKLAAFQSDLDHDPHGYWVLDVRTGQFGRQPGSLEQQAGGARPSSAAATAAGEREAALAPYRKTAETYLSLFSGDPKKALAIFDFLMIKTPLQPLSVADLNFTLRDAKTGLVVRVSLLDYIHTITTQTPPTKDVLDLHAYLSRHATLPRCFISNLHRKFAGK